METDSFSKKSALAQKIITFIRNNNSATLSTSSQSVKGYPFGSLIMYDYTETGEFVIFISRISQHYKNLTADSRASIFIRDLEAKDPQAAKRLCVIGDFELVDESLVSDSYWKRFPNAPEYKIAHDFRFFKLKIERLRWIGGFGEINWLSPADLSA